MPTNPNSATPRQLERDAVADILDQFYLNVGDETGSIEEQEDVGLYSLYDHRTPQPRAKSPSPNPKSDSPLNKPIDQEVLAKKLWNHLESRPHNNKPDSRYGVGGPGDCLGKGPSVSVGASGVECGGMIDPTASPSVIPHKN